MPHKVVDEDTSAYAPADEEPVVSLLRRMYGARVYVAETFSYMLENYTELTPDQRRKLHACRRLEIAMGRRLFTHLTQDLGLSVRPPARVHQAVTLLAWPRHATWFDKMGEMEQAAIRGVQVSRGFKTMYQSRDANLCATLLASRMALRDFARDELDEMPEVSLGQVLALLDTEDREAIASFI
jgi:hypothetical protein